MPVDGILDFLLALFQRWGLPKAVRTDNGEPFGVPTRDVVPMMSLWLKAWGVTPILNPPRTPTDNPKVERGQGTTSRWAEPAKCRDLSALQRALDSACTVQREKYPVVRLGKVTRSQLHKSLFDKARPFDRTAFDIGKAHKHLAKALLPRKVSSNGVIAIYSKYFSVGVAHKGKVVMVKFNPANVSWLVLEQNGSVCNELPDPRFSKDCLLNLKCQ